MKTLLSRIIQHYQANLRVEGGWQDMFTDGCYNPYAMRQLERAERILRIYERREEKKKKTKLESIREDTSFCNYD